MSGPERRPVALVTGASGGIGAAIAAVLAGQGEPLVLVARSAQGLDSEAAKIRAGGGEVVLTVPLDLARPDAVAVLREALARDNLVVRDLVNNAGYGLAADAIDGDRQTQLGMVDLNCRALLDLTLSFLPDIVEHRGGVLNVASVAGFTAGPGMAVYYATKAFVVSFTRALAYETRLDGIRVSALCPGPVPTGFGARAGFDVTRLSRLARPLSAEAVARIGVLGWQARRPVVVAGWFNRIGVVALKLLPQGLVLPVLAKAQRQRRPEAQDA